MAALQYGGWGWGVGDGGGVSVHPLQPIPTWKNVPPSLGKSVKMFSTVFPGESFNLVYLLPLHW